MFDFYLGTVIVYIIVIYGLLYLFAQQIADNGWTNGIKRNNKDPHIALLFMAAIPILRIAIVFCLIYMTTHTKEHFEKYKEEHQKRD